MEKIKITYPFCIGVAVLVFFDQEGRLFSMITAALLHEIGHILAMHLCRIPYEHVEIGIKGAVIHYGKGKLSSYKQDMFIGAMGCGFNLLAIGVSLLLTEVMQVDFAYFIGCNMVFMLFNSLPALPLDGGRVLYAAIANFTHVDTADLVLNITTAIVSIGGVAAGVSILCFGGNFTLLVISSYLLFLWIIRNKNLQKTLSYGIIN